MKRTILIAIAIPTLVISLMVAVCPQSVRGEPSDSISFLNSGVTVYSPVNMTYYNQNLFLNISLSAAGNLGSLNPQISMNYSIDGIYNGSVPLRSNGEIHVVTVAVGTISLPLLPDGSHELTVYLYGYNFQGHQPEFKSYVNTVHFSIDDPNSIFTPTPSPKPTPTLTPSQSPTPFPSPSPSPSLTPSPSPTQQPTSELIQSASPTPFTDVLYGPNLLLIEVGLVLAVVAIAVGTLVYVKTHKKQK
jgi:hypothetical protein